MTSERQNIAIVMPVWRQVGLADEAISSVLAQTCPDWRLIIVNDGCPDRETQMSLEAWALRDSRITVLSTANGGLSAARNCGIDHALGCTDVASIFFLDADNLLDPGAVALFLSLLKQESAADWFYPQFDMFGNDSPQSHGGAWSLARMAISNTCDAGSLVRRRVFERALRFDTALKSGFEDWDFWLRAAASGHVGHAVETSFFRYRKRGHSMLRAAHENMAAMEQTIRARHAWLFNTGHLARVYAKEWPRFAFVDDKGRASFGDLPGGEKLAQQAVHARWFAADIDSFSARLPQCWVFGAPEAYEKLAKIKRLGSVLLQAEASLDSGEIAAVYFDDAETVDIRAERRHIDKEWQQLSTAALIAVPQAAMATALDGADLLDCINRLMGRSVVAPYRVTGPDMRLNDTIAADSAIAFVAGLMESPYHHDGKSDARPWRKPAALVAPHELGNEVAKLNLGGLHLPGQTYGGINIGFALPILSFGGVEKCVVALAGELKKLGANVHLFLIGNAPAKADQWLSDPFCAIHQVSRAELRDWAGSTYFGTADGRPIAQWLAGRILGPLTAMDIFVNAGCGPLNASMAALRNYGVKTATWEHLVDSTQLGRPSGTPYLAMSNESAFDKILTCSHRLANWLHGQGVSRDRLVVLQNGPGFPHVFHERAVRPVNGPLRVGFMGRLDRQKGADRFLEIAHRLCDEGYEFSIMGANVIDDENQVIPHFVRRRPPASTPEDLAIAYAQIDVLLMPSRAEGLPLSILEAQRAGVVPLVSDVGAVAEVIDHGVNGVLLDPYETVSVAVEWLRKLNADRRILKKMGQASDRTGVWRDNAQRLLAAMDVAPPCIGQ